jgi:3-phosphoshikimate 1-carboxyvinyltransferase
MSHLAVQPGGPLRGSVRVPGDKSISHRALLLAAIAEGTSRVEGFLPAGDCLATLRSVRALGIGVEEHSQTTLIVHGRGLHGLQEPDDVLDCGRSGTTMRLLAGILAGQRFTSLLTGDAQLRRRPMGRIVEPLRRMGATVLGREDGRRPPLALRGGDLRGIDYELPVASAQLKSALLLAGLYASGPTTLHVPGPARDHTERMLIAMGGKLEIRDWRLEIEPGGPLQPQDIVVPGDLSSAAFLVVAATLVPGSEITIEGVGVNPTRTGLLDVLQGMGADIARKNERIVSGEPVADLTIRAAELHGVEVSGTMVVRAIDELPVLAVAATQARGQTVLRDAAELRVKETDRIATTVQELRLLGAEIEPQPDGFFVCGPTPLHSPATECVVGTGASVRSHGDHRLAMALTVAGLVASGETVVQNTDCIADSYPAFEGTLKKLGQGIEYWPLSEPEHC